MSKIVYLTEAQVEQLLAIANRIEQFQHRTDAAQLRSMVEVSE